MGVGFAAALWRMLAFFTMLTTLAVAFAMAAVAAGRWPGGGRPSPVALAGLALNAAFLGLVYYALLAGERRLAGAALWVDVALHALLPLATLAFWWRFARKAGLAPRHVALWALWPALYSAYALLRGGAEGWYPYFFLDPTRLGAEGVAAMITALLALFGLLGLAFVALARRGGGPV